MCRFTDTDGTCVDVHTGQYTLWEVKRVHVAVNSHASKDRVELWAFQTTDATSLKRTREQRDRHPRPTATALLDERGARVSECSNGELLPDVSRLVP